jgi:hypothetical protein
MPQDDALVSTSRDLRSWRFILARALAQFAGRPLARLLMRAGSILNEACSTAVLKGSAKPTSESRPSDSHPDCSDISADGMPTGNATLSSSMDDLSEQESRRRLRELARTQLWMGLRPTPSATRPRRG